MANNSVPKHDFAPAWLKIPQNGNSAYMQPKSYVGNSVEHQHEKPGRHSRWDGYHGSHSNNTDPDYAHSRQRHYSFDNHYVHRASQETEQEIVNEWRSLYHHHSLDSEGSDYSDSSNHSTPIKPTDYIYHSGHSRYWNHYGPHVNSSPRRSQSRTEYRDTTYKVSNNSSYHNGNHAQSQYQDNSFTQGSRGSKWNECKNEDSSQNHREENILNSDFPSLTRESLTEEIVKPVVNGGVWDNPPNSKVHSNITGRKIQLVQKSIKSDIREKSNQSGNNLTASSNTTSQKSNPHTTIINQINKTTIQNQANSAIYRVFVPPKELIVNGGSTSSLVSSSKPPTPTSSFAAICFSKEIPLRQSPTPPLEILSTRFVTQPKTLSNKKSDFLKTLRSGQGKNDSGEENKNEDSEDEKVIHELSVTKKSCYEDTNDEDGISMQHLSVDPPQRAILSSSLEAEQRLLREMGWKDEGSGDEAVYAPLTEDEMKEFQALTKKVQQRNSLTKTLPINWSPKRMPFCTNPIPIPSDTWTSSSDESDFD